MAMDLILSDTGALMIASNQSFLAPIASVNLHAARETLSIAYAGDHPPLVLSQPVHARLKSDVCAASRVMVVYFKGGFAVEGYDVPLVQVAD